jgi:hypothetical protein
VRRVQQVLDPRGMINRIRAQLRDIKISQAAAAPSLGTRPQDASPMVPFGNDYQRGASRRTALRWDRIWAIVETGRSHLPMGSSTRSSLLNAASISCW